MKLIVGLGNPGPKYRNTRHNIGFRVVDVLAEMGNPGVPVSYREKFKGHFMKARLGGEDVALLKPMTFMNLSGESVRPAMDFFDVPIDDVIVIHDELDLDPGTLRLKVGGGTAGHNGLKSIVQHASADFVRLRFGIGRPIGKGVVSNYVLSDFSADERITLSDEIAAAAKVVESVIKLGARQAMATVHQKKK